MTDAVPVPIRRLDPDLPPPPYAHPGDAGADLVAAEDVEIAPGGRALVRTGVAIALPDGYVGLVHPRSGLAARLGVTVLNAPGTVDAGYRGEILVNLVNHDPDASRRRSLAATASPNLSCSGWSGHTSTSSTSCRTPSGAPAGTARPAVTRACRLRRSPAKGGTVIFGRRGGSGRHARGEQTRRSGPRHAAVDRRLDEADGRLRRRRVRRGPYDGVSAGYEAVRGPYDVTEAPAGVQRLDLGSLQIPAIEGVEVRVQANPDGVVQQVVLVHGANALQLGVFAAPRSEGIWDEVRAEIRKSLFNDGVAAEEVDGRVRHRAARPGAHPGGPDRHAVRRRRRPALDGARRLPGAGGGRPVAGRAAGRLPARAGGRPGPGGQAGPRAAAAAAAEGVRRAGGCRR